VTILRHTEAATHRARTSPRVAATAGLTEQPARPSLQPAGDRGRELAVTSGLRVVAVDSDEHSLAELAAALRADARVAEVHTATDALAALRIFQDHEVDTVVLETDLPGMDGIELARILRRLSDELAIVYVTAYADRALEAYDVAAVDYVLKPLAPTRLAESIRRAAELRQPAATLPVRQVAVAGRYIMVDQGGRTRALPCTSVRWVEAHRDYAKLHTDEGSHLVRMSLTALAERWAVFGFVRIHRSYLVQLRLIQQLTSTEPGLSVIVDDRPLPVSRRYYRKLKDQLLHTDTSRATIGGGGDSPDGDQAIA